MRKTFKRLIATFVAVSMFATSIPSVYAETLGDAIVGEEDVLLEDEGSVTESSDVALEDQSEEDAQVSDPTEQDETLSYNVVFNTPEVDGGTATIKAINTGTMEVSYDSEISFEEGTILDYTITQKENFEVVEVTNQNGTALEAVSVRGLVSSYQIEVTADTQINTVYGIVEDTQVLNADVSATITTSIENGVISSTDSHRVGDDVEITFAPAKGYEVTDIKIDGASLEASELETAIVSGGYTFVALTQDHEIEVFTAEAVYNLTVKIYGMTVEQAKNFGSEVTVANYKSNDDEYLLYTIPNVATFTYNANKNVGNLINDKFITFQTIVDAGDLDKESDGKSTNRALNLDDLGYSRFIHNNYIYQVRASNGTRAEFNKAKELKLTGDVVLELFYSEVITFNYVLYNEDTGEYYDFNTEGAFANSADQKYLYSIDTNIFNSNYKYQIAKAPQVENTTVRSWYYDLSGQGVAVDIAANGVEKISKEYGYTEKGTNGEYNRSYVDLFGIYAEEQNISFAYKIGDSEPVSFDESNNVKYAFSTSVEKIKSAITNKINDLNKLDVVKGYEYTGTETDYLTWTKTPSGGLQIVLNYEVVPYNITVNVLKADANGAYKVDYTENVVANKHEKQKTFNVSDFASKANLSGYKFADKEGNKAQVTVDLTGDQTVNFYYDPYKVIVEYKQSDDGVNWYSVSGEAHANYIAYANFNDGTYALSTSVTSAKTAPVGYAYSETIGETFSREAMTSDVKVEVRYIKLQKINVQYVFPNAAEEVFSGRISSLYTDMESTTANGFTTITKTGVYQIPIGGSLAGKTIATIATPAGYNRFVSENANDLATGSTAVMPSSDITIVYTYTNSSTGTIQIQYVDQDGNLLQNATTASGMPEVSYTNFIKNFVPASEVNSEYYLLSNTGEYVSGEGTYVAGEIHTYVYTYEKYKNIAFDFTIAGIEDENRPELRAGLLDSITKLKADLAQLDKAEIAIKITSIAEELEKLDYKFTAIATNDVVSKDGDKIVIADTIANDVTVVLKFASIYSTVNSQVFVDNVEKNEIVIEGLEDLKLQEGSELTEAQKQEIEDIIKDYMENNGMSDYDMTFEVNGLNPDGTLSENVTIVVKFRSPKTVTISYKNTSNTVLDQIVLTTNVNGEKLYFGDSYDFSSYVLSNGENIKAFPNYVYNSYLGNYVSPEGGITEDVVIDVVYSSSGGGTVTPTPTPDPTPDPTPTTPDPTPVTPEPTPVTPEPTPVTPEPTPVTPDPTPVTPEPTPVTPAPTPVIPAPTPTTPVAVVDTPVTAETVISTPDDDTLTQIDDTETPLANTNLGGEAFCILHLLLMLAALVVLIVYTNSMKKRQEKLFELEEELQLMLLGKKGQTNRQRV